MAAKKPEEGVRVSAVTERRCRAGFCFDREGRIFTEGELDQAQIEALASDPLLKIERAPLVTTTEADA